MITTFKKHIYGRVLPPPSSLPLTKCLLQPEEMIRPPPPANNKAFSLLSIHSSAQPRQILAVGSARRRRRRKSQRRGRRVRPLPPPTLTEETSYCVPRRGGGGGGRGGGSRKRKEKKKKKNRVFAPRIDTLQRKKKKKKKKKRLSEPKKKETFSPVLKPGALIPHSRTSFKTVERRREVRNLAFFAAHTVRDATMAAKRRTFCIRPPPSPFPPLSLSCHLMHISYLTLILFLLPRWQHLGVRSL